MKLSQNGAMESVTLHSFTVQTSDQSPMDLSKLKGKVALVVNVASDCGFTPQYKDLEELYQKYKKHGFTVLAFPCNQFGAQEPGTDLQIQNFCKTQYQVHFPVLAKIDVNGRKAEPLFQWLKTQAPGILGTERIKWNFTKFLIGKDGQVLKRYAPNFDPKKIETDIKKALNT